MRVLRGAAFVWVVYGGLMFALQRRVIFPVWAIPQSAPAALPSGAEVWKRPLGAEGDLEAFFLPGAGVSRDAPGPAVMYFHGNGELIDNWVRPLSLYTREGYSVLIMEYRGYGRSGGSPSQDGLVDDARFFRDRLAADPRVAPDRLVFHGRSLGGGVACALARDRAPAALILQSTFTSMKALAWNRGLAGFLVRDPFDNLDAVRAIEVPVLVAHGRRDQVIALSHGEELARVAHRGRLVTYDADHNDCPPDWSNYMGEVLRFLAGAGIGGHPVSP